MNKFIILNKFHLIEFIWTLTVIANLGFCLILHTVDTLMIIWSRQVYNSSAIVWIEESEKLKER